MQIKCKKHGTQTISTIGMIGRKEPYCVLCSVERIRANEKLGSVA